MKPGITGKILQHLRNHNDPYAPITLGAMMLGVSLAQRHPEWAQAWIQSYLAEPTTKLLDPHAMAIGLVDRLVNEISVEDYSKEEV